MLFKRPLVSMPLIYFFATGTFLTTTWILSYNNYFPPQNTTLCACQNCIMDYEPGFSELLEKAPEPFLSTKNNLSESIFKWWQRLQGERANFTSYNKTVEKVFQMFPDPVLTEPSSDRCRTCAVVGNSGILNGSHYGPLIDFHDIVIRMNLAPIQGYEKDVGTKTTHHVMYPHSASNLDNSTRLVLFPFKTSDLHWLIRSFTPRDNKSKDSGLEANKDLVMILNPAFMKYVHHVWLHNKGLYPSTGFMTLILSLHICDEVDVFGFGADRDGNWYHYYEKLIRPKLRTGNHPGIQEYEVLLQLHRQKIIRYFRGW